MGVRTSAERSAGGPARATLASVNRSLVAEVALVVREPSEAAAAELERRRRELLHAPPLAELLELAARARRNRATDEELAFAVEALVAVHAPPAGAYEH